MMLTELERPKIKICGITNKGDAGVISASGADYAGFVCYKRSKRYVTIDNIKEISKGLYDNVQKVGVFVNSSVDHVREVYDKANLDIVQLHGEETEMFAKSLDLPYFKAIRVREFSDISLITNYKDDPNCLGILLDAFCHDAFGGTGVRVERNVIDQALIVSSKCNLNLMIAGGISKNNIKEFTSFWKNIYSFDLSSSVEVEPGLKDPSKVYAFFDEYHRINDQID